MTPLTIEFADNRPVRHVLNVSGGKDSYTLLAVLYELKWRGLLNREPGAMCWMKPVGQWLY